MSIYSAEDRERLVHMDLLRILAAFSVVMLHAAAQKWYSLPIDSSDWFVVNAYDAAFRFGVPIFVMISGSLFLRDRRELKLRRLYTHHVLRMMILYVIWSLAYLAFDLRAVPRQDIGSALIWAKLSVNRYHLWFLPMITGVYLILPILKRWVQNAAKREVEYFLALFFIFQIGRETVSALTRHMALDFFQNMISLYLVTGYLGYFVLGYYLTEYELSDSAEKLLYAGGIVSVPSIERSEVAAASATNAPTVTSPSTVPSPTSLPTYWLPFSLTSVVPAASATVAAFVGHFCDSPHFDERYASVARRSSPVAKVS